MDTTYLVPDRAVVDMRHHNPDTDTYTLPSRIAHNITSHAIRHKIPVQELLTRWIEWAYTEHVIQHQIEEP